MPEIEAFRVLQEQFGGPSQSAWGSAVFLGQLYDPSDLDRYALATYRSFIGELWDRFGEDAWMCRWRRVHVRRGAGDLLHEIETSKSRTVKSATDLLLNNNGSSGNQARAAICAAFDDAATDVVHVYEIGDGAAYSGLLIAARRSTGETAILAFVMD